MILNFKEKLKEQALADLKPLQVILNSLKCLDPKPDQEIEALEDYINSRLKMLDF